MNNTSAAILEWARRNHYHNGDTPPQKAVTEAAHELLGTTNPRKLHERFLRTA